MPVGHVVTDVEGTTSAIAFVKEVLFPYAAENLAAFVADNADNAEVAGLLNEVAAIAGRPRGDLDGLVEQMRRWIAEDQKITPLKSLQGLIWRSGYESDAYRAHVYADAWRNLKRWHAAGIRLYVYSSGSVAAQRLFFRHTEYGDLTPLFSGYFDTTTGPKSAVDSYREILAAIGAESGDTLFLSDTGAELDAAREAGMRTCWLARETDLSPAQLAAAGASDHPTAADFDQVVLSSGE